jgi:hypothetical protein
MWRHARECVVAVLLVVLPFQSMAAVLLDLQGPAHVHAGALGDDDDHHHDDHDGGHDQPQVRHRHDDVAAHDHHHGPFDRHHHDADDTTVVMVDEDGGDDRAGGWSATLVAAMPASPALQCAARRPEGFAPDDAACFRTRVPGLPDRPPRSASL